MPGRPPPIRHSASPLARGLLALGLAAMPISAGRAAEAPTAAVPVPPPMPPERPDTLKPPAPAPAEAMPPVPPPRPAELTPSAAAPPKAVAKDAAKDTAKDAAKPVSGTDSAKPEIPTPPPTPPGRPPELSGQAALALKVSPPDDTACRTRLKRLGVDFEPLPPIAEGQCTAPLPLKVTRFADGVALPQGATLTCRTAEALARWATEVQAEADRILKHPLTGLELGGSYVCRGQNHDLDAKLSEHAFANAADIMGFTFAGRASIPVKTLAEGSDDAQFLAAVRGKACGFFRTVLGPGTNAAHANHFHLDERERNGGHRLCE